MGLDRLWDFLFSILNLFKFWEVLNEYEKGVILTLGRPPSSGWRAKFRKQGCMVGPGLHWILPFHLESIVSFSCGLNSKTIQELSLATADGVKVSIGIGCEWRIVNVYEMAIGIEDDEDVVYNRLRLVLAEEVRKATWAEMCEPAWHKKLLRKARGAVSKYGIEITQFGVSDLVDLDFAGRLIQ